MTALRALRTLDWSRRPRTRGQPITSSTAATPMTMQVSTRVKPRRSDFGKGCLQGETRNGRDCDWAVHKAGVIPKAKSLGDNDRTELARAASRRDVRGVQWMAQPRPD